MLPLRQPKVGGGGDGGGGKKKEKRRWKRRLSGDYQAVRATSDPMSGGNVTDFIAFLIGGHSRPSGTRSVAGACCQ